MISTIRAIIPTANAMGLKVPIQRITCSSFSIVSIGAFSKIPMITRKIPAIMVAAARPSSPFFKTIPATIEANAAVGPAICTLLPPKKEITKPATMAV